MNLKIEPFFKISEHTLDYDNNVHSLNEKNVCLTEGHHTKS